MHVSLSWLTETDNIELESSVLFDTVAVYLAYSTLLCKIEDLPIEVTNDGVTRIATDSDSKANRVACAVDWEDLAQFHVQLVERLCRDKSRL